MIILQQALSDVLEDARNKTVEPFNIGMVTYPEHFDFKLKDAVWNALGAIHPDPDNYLRVQTSALMAAITYPQDECLDIYGEMDYSLSEVEEFLVVVDQSFGRVRALTAYFEQWAPVFDPSDFKATAANVTQLLEEAVPKFLDLYREQLKIIILSGDLSVNDSNAVKQTVTSRYPGLAHSIKSGSASYGPDYTKAIGAACAARNLVRHPEFWDKGDGGCYIVDEGIHDEL